MKANQRLPIDYSSHVLLVVVKGECYLSNIYERGMLISSNKIILIPSSSMACLACNKKAKILIVSFGISSLLSISYMNKLMTLQSSSKINQIDLKERLHSFLLLVESYIDDGINDMKFYEILRSELFYLIQLYYGIDEVYSLFKPLLNSDLAFKQKIIDNCLAVSSLNELAILTNYSKSGFIQKFQRCFGLSPYKWILGFKIKRILHEIRFSDKPFKEIADNYGFASYSYFYTFCKKHYNMSPNSIRKVM